MVRSSGLPCPACVWSGAALARQHLTVDFSGDAVLCSAQVKCRLQAHPASCITTKILRQTQRGIGCYRTALADNIIDARCGNSQRGCQRVCAHFQRNEKIFAQNLAGMHRTHAVFDAHVISPLVIVHNFHIGWSLIRPYKAHSPLPVDPDAVLPLAVAGSSKSGLLDSNKPFWSACSMPGACQKTRTIKYDNRIQRPSGLMPATFDLAHLTPWLRIYAGACLLETSRTRISPGDSDIRQAREMRSASSGENCVSR